MDHLIAACVPDFVWGFVCGNVVTESVVFVFVHHMDTALQQEYQQILKLFSSCSVTSLRSSAPAGSGSIPSLLIVPPAPSTSQFLSSTLSRDSGSYFTPRCTPRFTPRPRGQRV